MKKTLKLVLVLVLALVMVLALVACDGEHDCAKDGHEYVDGVCKHCQEKEEVAGGDLPAGLPVEEGKVTFYLTLKDITLEARNSIWLCGPMNYTEDSSDFGATAVEMIRLGETDVYYVQIDAAKVDAGLTATANPGEYQLVLGWNASSGASADKQGVNWSFKFDQTTSGLDNPKYSETYKSGDQTYYFGDVTFSCGQPPAPVKLDKVTFSVSFADPIPEGWIVCMPGSHKGWDNTIEGDKMTPNADRTVWTLTVENIYEGEYEYQILAEKADAEGLTWANHLEGAPSGNEKVTIGGLDNNGTVPLHVDAAFPADLFAAKDVVENVTLKVTLSAPLAEGEALYLPGTLTGSWTVGATAMTASDDGLTWTIVLSTIDAGNYECAVVKAPAGAAADYNVWDGKCNECSAGNLQITISLENANGEVLILADPTFGSAE